MACQREQQDRMIGVVHRDPAGADRLWRGLRALRPELITLEVSPFGVEFRQLRGPRLLKQLEEMVPADRRGHDEILSLIEMLQVPFEARGAESYALESGAIVELVGDSVESRELLSTVETELLAPQNVAALLSRPDSSPDDSVASLYARHRRLRDREPIPPAMLGIGDNQLEEMRKREDGLEDRIRRVRARHEVRRWVHVGGVMHLMRARGLRLLWERFAGEGVSRVFLDEL